MIEQSGPTDSMAGRSAGDILSRTVRLTLGGTEYVLPVLTIGGNRRWKATLDREMAGIFAGLRKARGRNPALLELLEGQVDQMLDLLVAYDTTHVLPDREALEEATYEAELIDAIQEVWLAANPLAAIAIRRMRMAETNGSSPPTNISPPSTAGRRRRSKKN